MRPRAGVSSPGDLSRMHHARAFVSDARVVAVTTLSGLIITALLFCYLRSSEEKHFESRFKHSAQDSSELIKERLGSSLLLADAVRGFLESQSVPSPDSFSAYTAPLVARCPEVKAVEWIPAVPVERLDDFEREWRRTIGPAFRTYQRSSSGEDQPVARRPVYYPVLLAVPLKTNEKAIGFDLGSTPSRLATLNRARDTGLPSVTERVKLVQEDGTHFGFLLALPVYRQAAPKATVDERRLALRGFALAVFNADQVLGSTVGRMAPTGIDSRLLDLSAPEESSELSFDRSRQRSSNRWKRYLLPELQLRSLDKFSFAGREWAIELIATDDYVARNYAVLFWLVLPAGIAITLLLSRYLSVILRRRQTLEAAVAEQTASLRLYAAALETAANAIVITDATGKILWVNPAFTDLTGYAEEEAAGKTPRLLKSGQQDTDFYGALWQTITSGRVWEGELVNRRKDGSQYVEEMTIAPVRLDGGEITHFIAIKVDATERRQALAALRASEERYRTMFENNLAGVFHASPRRLLDCNEALCQMLGYNREELAALDLRCLYCDPAASSRGLKTVLRTGKLTNYGVDLKRKDGTTMTVLANLNLLREEAGTAPVIAGVVLDISEVRKLQQQLLQSQKLEAIGKLSGGIAHDFNNILMIINCYCEMVLGRLDAESSLGRQVEKIRDAGARAAALTRQLLAFSRKQPMAPVPLQLDAVLSRLKEMLKRLIGEDVSLEIASTDGLWLAKVDPSQIEQVVFNLVVNARDAMPDGGKLLIQTANCELSDAFAKVNPGASAGQYVVLSVSDTGCGMTQEVQSRIFEPFFTTKGPGKGTGLGLSTVYGIVRQSGGHITVESKPDAGATFCIYLPRATDSAETVVVHRSAGAAPEAMTVLLVEDEGPTREAISDYLSHHGFRVLPASNAQEALRVCDARNAGSIDVLLTDVVMPGMSGIDLAAIFHESHPNARILFMSGYTDDTLSRSGVKTHEFTVLTKPFHLDDLALKLRGLMSKAAQA